MSLYDLAIQASPAGWAFGLTEQLVWAIVIYWLRCNGGWQVRRLYRRLAW